MNSAINGSVRAFVRIDHKLATKLRSRSHGARRCIDHEVLMTCGACVQMERGSSQHGQTSPPLDTQPSREHKLSLIWWLRANTAFH